MPFEIRISQPAIRNCFALALLTVAPVAWATGALDSIYTISLDKKAYQMGENITVNCLLRNPTKQPIIMPYTYGGGVSYVRFFLTKKRAYGKPFFASGEPDPVSAEDKDPSYIDKANVNKGTQEPPGNVISWKEYYIYIPSNIFPLGLNPRLYVIQSCLPGGPLPQGRVFSNEIEFEVLEPQGVDRNAWNLLSRELKNIETKVDSLEKAIKRANDISYGSKGLQFKLELLNLEVGPYREIVRRHPNTTCAQVAVKYLGSIYSDKFFLYQNSFQFDRAKEEAKKIVPDSLRTYFEAKIEAERNRAIKRIGKERFDQMIEFMKHQEEMSKEEQKKNK